jgi:phage terminase small subunit
MSTKPTIEIVPGVLVSAKHERFIREVLIDNNARRAYEAAGYSLRGNEKTTKRSVNELLHNDRAQDALKVLRGRLNAKLNITAERVLAEVAAIAFSDLGEFFSDGWRLKDNGELSPALTKVLASVKIRETTTSAGETIRTIQITLCNKLEALDKLMKHLQLYEEQKTVLVGYDWAAEMEKRRARAKARS